MQNFCSVCFLVKLCFLTACCQAVAGWWKGTNSEIDLIEVLLPRLAYTRAQSVCYMHFTTAVVPNDKRSPGSSVG